MMASALMFFTMATSVVKARDFTRLPKMRMPPHSLTQWGRDREWLRRVPV